MAVAATSPADAGGQFSPVSIQLALEAGTSVAGTLYWTNPTPVDEKISVSTKDLAVNPLGQLVVQPLATSQFILGKTLSVSLTEFTLKGGVRQPIDYIISLPADLTRGDYLGAIVFDVESPALPKHEVAIPIMIRVGDDTPLTINYSTSAGAVAEARAATIAAAEKAAAAKNQPMVYDGDYEITKLITRPLTLFAIEHEVTFFNKSDFLVDALAMVTYADHQGVSIGSTTASGRLLPPESERTVRVSAPPLYRATQFGRLPYVGPLQIAVHIPGSSNQLIATTWIVPWWLALLVLLSLLALVMRLTTYHPKARHQHLVFRYQGRISLSVMVASVWLAQVTGPLTNGTTTQITHSVGVLASASYQMVSDGSNVVISHQTNYFLQINTPDQIYILKRGDPSLTLPRDTPILLIGTFGNIQ